MNKSPNSLYKKLFKTTPGKVLVLSASDFQIVAATDDYLKATGTEEADIIGKKLFDVFPDNPDDINADGTRNLRASLLRVQSLKTIDVMAVQRYPVRLEDGSFSEKYWSPVNSPVLDDDGNLEFIMHRVEDVTNIFHEGLDKITENAGQDQIAIQDIILRSQELRQALSKNQEHEARMRTAERMLGLGTWEYNPQSGQLNWSSQVFNIYDVPESAGAPTVEQYFTLLHPDDRHHSLERYKAFKTNHADQIEFEHRVITRDGSIRFIKGVGERHLSTDGELVVGYVQDISSLIETRHKLSEAEQLLRLAGEKVKLGGWRVVLATETIVWTPETARIHDMPSSYSPANVAEAIAFYAPEYREIIKDAFENCVQRGEEFDVVCRLLTPQGNQPWVRVFGVPEYDKKNTVVLVQGAFQDITDLQDALLKADRAELQRVNVLESISDAFFAIDSEWNFTYLNKKAEVLLERTRNDLLGRNIWQEFPQAAYTEFQRQYQITMHNRETCRFESFYPPLNKWFDVTSYPIPEGMAVFFRDVSEEHKTRQQLQLVEAALARQNDIVMITEADELNAPYGPRIVYVNDAFERITGYRKDEAIGRTPRMLQGPESNRAQLSQIRKALESKTAIRCEVLNYTKAGVAYWLELDITPLFNQDGQCSHFVAVERDITARKQQEHELRKAQERFELISKATHDVIWDWDFVTGAVWWNDSMEQIFGYQLTRLEPGPESWTNRIHPDDLDRVVEGIHHVIDGDQNYWQDEYRFIKNDGEIARVIDRGFVSRNSEGKAIRMVGSMLDMTERMSMEQQLRESQKLEAIGHLTGGVAHDFNNLLTVILGNAEMLVDELPDSEYKEMAAMTVAAAQRGAELTGRLLAFARRQPLDPKPTNINDLVIKMQPLFRRTLPEHIELQFALEQDLGITEIDAGELDTALLNLVVNARDAMTNGGKLTIETANVVLDEAYANRYPDLVAGEYIMVCVSDTGVGMTPETIRRAFEPFFTTKAIGKGSGLGLSMVFGFTKQSGGHIKIYSEPGEGTAIKLYFPKVRSAVQCTNEPKVEEKLIGGREHILIAEDDDLVLQYLKQQLISLGYRVTAVMSGPAALEVLDSTSDIALLLTDIIMPGGMNGRQLADRAQQRYPKLKVLFSSGYTENAIVHHGRLDPGVELLSKPYSRLELSVKVRRVLDTK